jgi:hypothetical protein
MTERETNRGGADGAEPKEGGGTADAPLSPLRDLCASSVRAVRAGHGANCSSIGSVIDTLFATATVGAAVFAAVLAALEREEVRVVAGPAGAAVAGEPPRTAGDGAGGEPGPKESP